MTITSILPNKQWTVAEQQHGNADEFVLTLGVHPVTARLLMRRGLRTPAEALNFLSPQLDSIHDPLLLPDAEKTVDRIVKAINDKQTIFVHGDYDVDGVTSAALLTRVLTKLGASVVPFVPSRARDGYGVRLETAQRAHAEGAGLMLTADCGISAHDACEWARGIGFDIIITDHHEQAETLPNAYAVVNPMRRDSSYPFQHLAGVGVAFKVCQALCTRWGVDLGKLYEHYLDLVALGTVADIVPLIGENRVYVYHGLRSIADTKKHGLKALIEESGINSEGLQADDIGFRLGPRLNAAGRLAEASESLELLLTKDDARAKEIAVELSRRNTERQQEQRRIHQQALEYLERNGNDGRVLLAVGDDWHPGVVGIVAGNLVDSFYRPTIVASIKDGMCHGSARSIPGFNLAHAIEQIGGGHARAAGLSFALNDLSRVQNALNELAADWLTEEQLMPSIDIEMLLDLDDLLTPLPHEIFRLAPFGEANPEPIFMSGGVRFTNVRCVGNDSRHMKADIAGYPVSLIGWGMGKIAGALKSTQSYQICYNLKINRFNGNERVELVLQDVPVEEQ